MKSLEQAGPIGRVSAPLERRSLQTDSRISTSALWYCAAESTPRSVPQPCGVLLVKRDDWVSHRLEAMAVEALGSARVEGGKGGKRGQPLLFAVDRFADLRVIYACRSEGDRIYVNADEALNSLWLG